MGSEEGTVWIMDKRPLHVETEMGVGARPAPPGLGGAWACRSDLVKPVVEWEPGKLCVGHEWRALNARQGCGHPLLEMVGFLKGMCSGGMQYLQSNFPK